MEEEKREKKRMKHKERVERETTYSHWLWCIWDILCDVHKYKIIDQKYFEKKTCQPWKL